MGTDRHEHLVPRSPPATSEVSSHGAVEADPLCSQPSKLRTDSAGSAGQDPRTESAIMTPSLLAGRMADAGGTIVLVRHRRSARGDLARRRARLDRKAQSQAAAGICRTSRRG